MRTVDRYLEIRDEIQRLEARQRELTERMIATGVRYLPDTAGTWCVVVEPRPQYRFTGSVDILERTIAGLQQRLMEQKQREIWQGKAERVDLTHCCTVERMTARIRAAVDKETGELLTWPDDTHPEPARGNAPDHIPAAPGRSAGEAAKPARPGKLGKNGSA